MSGRRDRSLTLGPDRDGRVLVVGDGRVASFGAPPADAGEGIDCRDARIEPGRVNAHTHIYSALAPLGMPPPEREPESFVQILERVWWRLDRAIDADSLRASARLYVAEALLAGTTTVIDHHESPNLIEGSLDILADAYEELGARGVLCYGATERNEGRDEARRGLAECRRFLETRRSPLVRALVGLHASFTVSDDTAREAALLCREVGSALHVHMAEDGADVEDARRRGYAGPLERLLELEALPAGSILAHGVFLDPDQVRLAADRGLWFVQNPRSNRGNRVGYPSALSISENVALGTDGYPSVMPDETTALAEEVEQHGDDEAAAARRLPAGRRLASGLFDVGLELARGDAADAIVLASDGAVRHVVVDGRLVVEGGQLLTADIEQIRSEAEHEAPLQWRRMEQLQ